MTVYYFSDGVVGFHTGDAVSATQQFPVELSLSLAKFVDTLVIVSNRAKEADEKGKPSNIQIISYRDFKASTHASPKEDRRVFLFSGYDPLKIIYCKYFAQKSGAKAVSYIFDSHRLNASELSLVKRVYVNARYGIGLRLINVLDGVIVYNEDAPGELKLKIPHTISRIGGHPHDVAAYAGKPGRFQVICAGSLYRHNGIAEMLEAWRMLSIPNAKLNVYGSGPLASLVEAAALKDQSIYWGGLVTQGELDRICETADLLLNIRDPFVPHVSRLSYPSKFISCLASGIPTVTTRFTSTTDLNAISYVAEEFSARGIAEAIELAYQDPQSQRKAEMATKYLRLHHDQAEITRRLIGFFNTLWDGDGCNLRDSVLQ